MVASTSVTTLVVNLASKLMRFDWLYFKIHFLSLVRKHQKHSTETPSDMPQSLCSNTKTWNILSSRAKVIDKHTTAAFVSSQKSTSKIHARNYPSLNFELKWIWKYDNHVSLELNEFSIWIFISKQSFIYVKFHIFVNILLIIVEILRIRYIHTNWCYFRSIVLANRAHNQ